MKTTTTTTKRQFFYKGNRKYTGVFAYTRACRGFRKEPQMGETCPFVGCECTGGMETATWAGCACKETPDARCSQLDEVPAGMQPRDWYIAQLMELCGREKA